MDDQIQDLGMLDTEYVACLAKGFDPVLDRNLIALFKDKPRYRHLTRFLELTTKDQPPTDAEWEEIYLVWDKMHFERGEKNSGLDREAIMLRWT
ncbi:hypothetical protein WA1_34055 [Scytonema hofmannii PCC 7110]|uniref:Uncharacterized protein n=1 Tax=Scytonema hofmannii PCC 7110 TaxID=128403 RepID=A0A139X2X7_9CYAN|nr:hypothetical protein [Scytonema hofmannii]KYC39016.1 hypothetical protein WA1_34055 [Scytonema hofmannii PCC 7110]